METFMPRFDPADFSFHSDYIARAFESSYGSNSLLVYVLSLLVPEQEAAHLAAEAITDGPDDKKIDACYIDVSSGRAIIAQSYLARQWGGTAAPASKASDLNTAMSWLLGSQLDNIPTRLRPKTSELREAIKDGIIARIELLYVHNCFESDNVDVELRTAAESARELMRSLGCETPSVSFREYGVDRIEELFRARDREILVDEEVVVDGTLLGQQVGEGWEALVVTVTGQWLFDAFKKYENNLFSANLRDFLGVSRHRRNINATIKQTAASSPDSFWVFNNGITILTEDIISKDPTIEVRGLSIINGAQTTGAIAQCARDELVAVARAVCCVEIPEKTVDFDNF